MTKYKFLVLYHQGNHLVVTRLDDGAQKYFFQAGADNTRGLSYFMESMTDELIESYFPKPGKRGGSPADNWAFLGYNLGRKAVEAMAEVDHKLGILVQKTYDDLGLKRQ